MSSSSPLGAGHEPGHLPPFLSGASPLGAFPDPRSVIRPNGAATRGMGRRTAVPEASRRSGRRLHESLVEVMADAVIGTDVDYRVTLWNPAAERLYGYSAEEAMGRPAREIATYENDTSRARARGRARPRRDRAR